MPHLCNVVWTKEGHVRNEQAKAARMLEGPKMTTLWAAGLSFSKCHAETKVKNDPHLDYIFDGEEFSRAARLWTHGYDFYTPPRTVIVHNYHRKRLGAWHNDAEEKQKVNKGPAPRIALPHPTSPRSQPPPTST